MFILTFINNGQYSSFIYLIIFYSQDIYSTLQLCYTSLPVQHTRTIPKDLIHFHSVISITRDTWHKRPKQVQAV